MSQGFLFQPKWNQQRKFDTFYEISIGWYEMTISAKWLMVKGFYFSAINLSHGINLLKISSGFPSISSNSKQGHEKKFPIFHMISLFESKIPQHNKQIQHET
jgi:hypothetical protein